MADLADKARKASEFLHDAAVKTIRNAPPAAKETGYCLYCSEPLSAGRRWCDADCCAAWERDQ